MPSMVQMTLPRSLSGEDLEQVQRLGGYLRKVDDDYACCAIPAAMNKIKAFVNAPMPEEPEEPDDEE